MRKLLFVLSIVGLFAVNSFGQYSTLWERCDRTTNKPAWFGSGTERGIAYGFINGTHKIYVLSRNGGNSIKVANANDGTDITLPTPFDFTGVSGGSIFTANDVELTEDGKFVVANLTDARTSNFKIYVWTSEGGTFTNSASFYCNIGAATRLGDKITVVGSWDAGTIEVWAPAASMATNAWIYRFKTTNQGTTWTKDSIQLSGAYNNTPANVCVAPFGVNSEFYLTGNGASPRKHSNTGAYVASSLMSTSASSKNAVKYFNGNGKDYIAVYGYRPDGGTGTEPQLGRCIIYDVDVPSSWSTYGGAGTTSPLLDNTGDGSAVNGDIAIRENGDGSFTIYILACNQGIAAYRTNLSPLKSPMLVDGNMNEDRYRLLAVRTGGTPWAPMQLDSILYYPDEYNKILYIGIGGVLDVTSNNGIGFWLDLNNQTGILANNTLGGTPGGHYMDGDGSGNNTTFKGDFEVDYMFAMNPGTSSNCYVDVVQLVSGRTSEYMGNCGLTGTTTPNNGGVFGAGLVQFAFDNAGTKGQGFEISIPFDQFSTPVTVDDSMNIFAFIVSDNGYFCSATIPGNIVGDPGFNPNFSTLPGGPFNTFDAGTAAPLPVELTTFSASIVGNRVNLKWETASENNNYGFEIQRAGTDMNWTKIGFVPGAGNSSVVQKYSYTDKEVFVAGQYNYRLKQIDKDGAFSYSNVLSVNIAAPTEYALNQNYPNPFNPSTTIQFALPTNANVKLSVFDILGKEVAVIENGQKEAGVYSVNFNASNLASGIYVYKLTANGTDGSKFTQTKKLVLMK